MLTTEGKFVKRMDKWLRNNINDEEIFFTWLYRVPDEASDEDFNEIGEDRAELAEITKLFARMVMDDN